MESNKYREIFIEKDIKRTNQRELVLDILMNSDKPLSVEKIYIELTGKENNMSLSTIYRILNVFISKELVVKSTISDNSKAVFALKGKKHKHNLICVSCEKILELDTCPIKGYEKSLEEMTMFDITSHRLEFFGVCPECKMKKEENEHF